MSNSSSSRLLAPEKKAINRALNTSVYRDVFAGNSRQLSKTAGLSMVNKALEGTGFHLEMVTGDIMLGNKGHRNLGIARDAVDGGDPVHIDNAAISYTWENLSTDELKPNYELIIYLAA